MLSLIRAAFLVVFSAAYAFCQQAPVPPPPDILQIYRDPVKPGKMPEYTKIEGEAAQACSRANTWPYLTLQAVTGPEEVWFISGFESYAAMEKSAEPFARNGVLSAELAHIMEAKANLVSDPRTVFLRYRDDLSHNHGLVRPQTRFFTVTVVRVQQGHEREYEDSQRLLKGVRERAAAADNRAVYQVVSGMPQNIYVTFSPQHSFREAGETLDGLVDLDDLDDGVRGRVRDLLATSVASTETFIFAISPPMSNPAGEWIADDPEFWRSSPPLQKQNQRK